ncbi:MAG: S9 family peptidase [Chloroflexi bacterium]|nr:S9 family peptidase [Chloroflexota bacterium]
MSNVTIAPYGSWRSPIKTDDVTSNTLRYAQIQVDGDSIYWCEMRPTEGGRYVIVQALPDGQIRDVTPPGFSARTVAHEYGGGAFTVFQNTIFFSNYQDQRLYRQIPGQEPAPLTPAGPWRYADMRVDSYRNRLICVREDHEGTPPGAPISTIVSVSLGQQQDVQVLLSGNDFYSNPRLSSDGRFLVWLAWNHPYMPWESSELCMAEVVQDDGSLGAAQRIAGGPDESLFQPEWSPDGTMVFVSDRTGWWNLYRWRAGQIEALTHLEAEFAWPQWQFGMTTYALISGEEIICSYRRMGVWHLARLDVATKGLKTLRLPYTDIRYPAAVPGGVVFIGGSPATALSVIKCIPETGRVETLRQSAALQLDPGYLTVPQAVEFPTTGGRTAYGFFYPPRNQDFTAPAGELPPLLVKSHGGPTSAAEVSLNPEYQYWTSRGVAILDVNYGGSAGYGRAYRQRLDGQWGVVDVDDCVNGARYLVELGLVDGQRLCIDGGSAGGYTTLSALTFRDVFKAGASKYGIGDLETMVTDTHKFESHYLDSLIGPYPAQRELYYARSPIHFAERLNCPVILFQGLEDKVVPPSQAEQMVAALRAKGIPFAYMPFAGEQHGFRRAGNIKRTLEAELYFYSRVFGFDLADPVEPVEIENL